MAAGFCNVRPDRNARSILGGTDLDPTQIHRSLPGHARAIRRLELFHPIARVAAAIRPRSARSLGIIHLG